MFLYLFAVCYYNSCVCLVLFADSCSRLVFFYFLVKLIILFCFILVLLFKIFISAVSVSAFLIKLNIYKELNKNY